MWPGTLCGAAPSPCGRRCAATAVACFVNYSIAYSASTNSSNNADANLAHFVANLLTKEPGHPQAYAVHWLPRWDAAMHRLPYWPPIY